MRSAPSVARAVGISTTFLYDIEKGRAPAPAGRIADLTLLLQLTDAELIELGECLKRDERARFLRDGRMRIPRRLQAELLAEGDE